MEVKDVLQEFDSIIGKIVEDRNVWIKLGNTTKSVTIAELDRYLDAGWQLKDDCGCKEK